MKSKNSINVSELADFINKEVSHENRHHRHLRESSVEKSLAHGDILGPLKVKGRDRNRHLVLRGENLYFSRFRIGDVVELSAIDPINKNLNVEGYETKVTGLNFPSPGVVELTVAGRNIPDNSTTEYFALPTSVAAIKRGMRQRLLDHDSNPYTAERSPVSQIDLRRNLKDVSNLLNETQVEALKFLIDQDLHGLVQGPPGTGKTHLLVALVQVALKSGLKIGLASLAHSAVDNALSKILKAGVDLDLCVRIASESAKVGFDLYSSPGIEDAVEKSLGSCDRRYQLFAATMHSWCMTNNPPEIDLLIIDEASQVPVYFYPFLSKLVGRVIMFGDHKQLPPVIQSSHNLEFEDIFSYEISQGRYPMLEVQYRMNEDIQSWSSGLFYDGRLQPHESVRQRDILSGKFIGNTSRQRVSLITHNGPSSNYANPLEASKVADLVAVLNGQGGLPLAQIGVVSPHRAHAGSIFAALQNKLGLQSAREVLVDTVERFQGQEREAMIFSVGVEKDDARRGDKAFLGDGRRLNVAVTRAKSRFYCFAPQTLIESGLTGPSSRLLADFLSWCGSQGAPGDRKVP